MKIVVTGALGHIGSSLIRALPDRFPGAEIVMIDNMMTQRYVGLFNLPKHGRYRFIEADVCTAPLTEIVRGASGVVHLAAITNAEGSVAMRETVERVNYGATKAVAEACTETGVPMIFPSSTSVYGTQASLVDENCTREELQPQSPYAETKLKEEDLLREMGANGKLKYIACRFGTIFGPSPGIRFHTAVNKFCWQAAMGIPVTVWRTAMHQKRPYLDVDDAVQAVAFLLERQRFPQEIFNVVTLNATVADIVDAIRAFIPSLEVKLVDSPIMNQLSYEVANLKFKALGFGFTGDLKAQVGRTIELIRQANSLN